MVTRAVDYLRQAQALPPMKEDTEWFQNMLDAILSGWAPRELKIEGYTDEQIGYHALIMIEAGLVTGQDVATMGSSPTGLITRLTWQGHDFLEAAREPTRCRRPKQSSEKLEGPSAGLDYGVNPAGIEEPRTLIQCELDQATRCRTLERHSFTERRLRLSFSIQVI